jgi:hypothetical protein
MIYAATRLVAAAPQVSPGGRVYFPLPLPQDNLSAAMRNLAVDSGGGYRIFSTTEDARSAMQQVANELHHQYLLGFIPAVLDGKVHKLEVTTRRRGMSVQARKNFIATAP